MDLSSFVDKASKMGVLGVKVSQHGELIGEWFGDDECRRNVYSVTKSYTSCAVGFAWQEGLLSLDEKLTDAFPDDLPDHISENLKKATVRDLLTMRLGQADAHLMGGQRPKYKETDWVKMSLAIPFDYAPDTHFVYNNVGPYLAGILVQRRSGCNLVSYLMPRLFSHMGIHLPTWEVDPMGNSFGAGGLFLNLEEIKVSGTANSSSPESGLRKAPGSKETILMLICFGGANITPSVQMENMDSTPLYCRIRMPSFPLCPNADAPKN